MRRLTVAVLVPGLFMLGACCGAAHGMSIEWVDLVQLNGVTYLAVPPTSAGSGAPDLGPQVATTTRRLAGSETEPSHKLQEGEAAFLPAGTAVYSLHDYKTSFRVAVSGASGIVIYEADTNPTAKVGADLLDLDGKVDQLTIGDSNGLLLSTIREPALVTHLVGLMLQAPVDQSVPAPAGGPQYFVTIRFHDGTQTVRAFWPSTGQLQRGITAGPEFARAIQGTLPSPAP